MSSLANRLVRVEVHAFLAKVIHRNFLTKVTQSKPGAEVAFVTRGKGKLRWLTVPDSDWSGERLFMSSLPRNIANRVEEVVGIEQSMDKGPLRHLRQAAEQLETWHKPTVFTPCRTSDKQPFLPGTSSPRAVSAPDRGFDMVWLNYCSPLTDKVLCSLSMLAENIAWFDRAWRCGRPGLLFITLQMGDNFKSAMNTLDWVHHNLDLPSDYLQDSYRVRTNGISELLNSMTIPLGFSCLPTHWVFYHDDLSDSPSSRMYLLGFEVWKGRYDTEPEYKRFVKRCGTW